MMQRLKLKLHAVAAILRCYKNPWLVIAMRLGFLKLPYFAYRVRNAGHDFVMLARPASSELSDIFVLREVLVEEAYRDILPLLPKSSVRLLDIGANLGSFTIWLNHRVGVSEAYCFEPEPDNFRLLRFNLSNNGCDHVHAMPVAVGGEERTIRISLKSDSPGGTSIYAAGPSQGAATEVPVISLEGWLSQNRGDFDVLKMDCEGAEWEILERMPASLFQRFKIVVMEVHSDPSGKRTVAEFEKLMIERGFQTVRWDGHSHGLYVGRRELKP